MEQLTLQDIYSLYREIKQKAKKAGKALYTNIYQYYNQEAEKIFCEYRMAHCSLVFSLCDEKKICRVYFLSYDLQELSGELAYFSEGTILDYICKGVNLLKGVFDDGGFKKIAVYTRKSIDFMTEGKEFKRSHSEILDKYYDETIGEYATIEDAEEIVQLLEDVFDKDTDHIPTVEEVMSYAKRHWVLVYRVSGVIRALYIYQVQGKKFYSNISYNSLPAIVLYCLEKRAHMEVVKNYDVIMKYSWIDIKNEKSLRRNILNFDDVYTYIYKKV